jgi:hypothetical protein
MFDSCKITSYNASDRVGGPKRPIIKLTRVILRVVFNMYKEHLVPVLYHIT